MSGIIQFGRRRRVAFVPALFVVWFVISSAVAWEWSATPNEGQAYLDELTMMKEREGRDNALIHYVRAIQLIYDQNIPGFRSSNGADVQAPWDVPRAWLEKMVEISQPIIEQVRAGAALDFAKGPGLSEQELKRPYSYAFVHVANLVINEGYLFELKGQYGQALETYLAVLTMGRDLQADSVSETFYGVSLGIQSQALARIMALVRTSPLDAQALPAAFDRLERIEASERSYAENRRALDAVYRPSEEEFEARLRKEMADERYIRSLRETGRTLEDYEREQRGFHEQSEALRDLRHAMFETPWWERDIEKIEAEEGRVLEKMPGRFQQWADSSRYGFLTADLPWHRFKTELTAAKLTLALEIFRFREGRYPDDLRELVPAYLRAMPVDPFGGGPFGYERIANGGDYVIWSVGPDGQDDSGRTVYGSSRREQPVSPDTRPDMSGDIVFGPPPRRESIERSAKRKPVEMQDDEAEEFLKELDKYLGPEGKEAIAPLIEEGPPAPTSGTERTGTE